MGEAVWPAEFPGAYLATMLGIIVVLFGEYEDQFKSGLEWMEV